MVEEVTVVELYGENSNGAQRRFTCASGVKISKGTILKLTDPRTAIAASALYDPIAGIASMDKSSSDFSTSITCWTDGIFECIASGGISTGAPVMWAGLGNYVGTSGALDSDLASGASILGYALEDSSDEETINVRVRL